MLKEGGQNRLFKEGISIGLGVMPIALCRAGESFAGGMEIFFTLLVQTLPIILCPFC